jgi:hypothetical protein
VAPCCRASTSWPTRSICTRRSGRRPGVTGEGYLDEQSFEGKVVGGVQAMCAELGRPVVAVVGDSAPEVRDRIVHRSLVADFGAAEAMNQPLRCIEQATSQAAARVQNVNNSRDPRRLRRARDGAH